MVSKRVRRAEAAVLDEVNRRLLLALSRDGRRSAAALAKELGLSRQAVTERIRDLEAKGIIRGYRADVDPKAFGLSVRAQMRLTLDGGAPARKQKEVLQRLTRNPWVRSVYRVSGEDCFVAQILCGGIEDVNALLAELQATRAIQSSRTAFVLEVIVEKDGAGPLEGSLLSRTAPSRGGA
jgi:Lrp/AsnC family leucine-responsive transcriptional regulator